MKIVRSTTILLVALSGVSTIGALDDVLATDSINGHDHDAVHVFRGQRSHQLNQQQQGDRALKKMTKNKCPCFGKGLKEPIYCYYYAQNVPGIEYRYGYYYKDDGTYLYLGYIADNGYLGYQECSDYVTGNTYYSYSTPGVKDCTKYFEKFDFCYDPTSARLPEGAPEPPAPP